MALIIFDLDGTLIDSVALIVETVTAAFEAVNEPPPTETAIRSVSGITARDAMAILTPHAGPERVAEITASYKRHYLERAGVGRESLFAGTLDALDKLQRNPETIVAVATGKAYNGAITLLESHGLIERFHSIQTPDHNRGKPDPQMLHTAMEKAGASPAETVMIGDTTHDMHMAKAAGVHAIGVAWGYHDVFELEEAGADVIVERMDGLVSAIDELLGTTHA